MKNYIWGTLLGIVALAGCAQLTPVSVADQNKPIVVTIASPGKTQSQLYTAARLWFTRERKQNHFGNDGGKITNDDQKTAFIAQVLTADIPCEGIECQIANLPCDAECLLTKENKWLSYKLRIDAQDEKITMTYTDFIISDAGNMVSHEKLREHPIEFQADLDRIKKGVMDWAKELIASVKKDRSLTTDGLPAVNE